MSSYNPDSSESKELLEVNIVDEMSEVLKAIDGKISPEMMDKLDWTVRAIQVRLSILEGNVSILHQSHLNQANTSLIEFRNMHGFLPGVKYEPSSVKESDIGKLMTLTTELHQCITEMMKWEDAEDYHHAMNAAIKILADAAGMEVVDRG